MKAVFQATKPGSLGLSEGEPDFTEFEKFLARGLDKLRRGAANATSEG